MIKDDERREILEKLDYEGGFDYMIHGSDFTYATKDKKFHKLRNNLVAAWEALEEYLGDLGDFDDSTSSD